jgi:hypothetical protein
MLLRHPHLPRDETGKQHTIADIRVNGAGAARRGTDPYSFTKLKPS